MKRISRKNSIKEVSEEQATASDKDSRTIYEQMDKS
jgi:hypothetical protein